jgi:hypothetical protein
MNVLLRLCTLDAVASRVDFSLHLACVALAVQLDASQACLCLIATRLPLLHRGAEGCNFRVLKANTIAGAVAAALKRSQQQQNYCCYYYD